MNKHFSVATVVSALLAALATSTATAQVATQGAQSTTSDDGIEEVMVTAQRRAETLERTPVSVAVLDSSDLAEQAVVTESDFQTAFPGLTVKASQSANQLNFAIRGQTVDAFSSSRPSVLPYINEVQIGGSASSAFYDLQSIQVLKGPQGTLFGRNSTGGAVLITTAKPTNEFGGYASAWFGNYSEVKAEGALNVPLVDDKVLLRIAGYYQKRDGYQKNLFRGGETLGDVDKKNARLSLTLKPTDRLTNDLVLDFADSSGNNLTSVAYNAFAIGEGNPFVPANFLYSPLVDTAFGPGAWAAFQAAHPGVDPGGWNAAVAAQQARGPFDVSVDAPNFHEAETLLISNITTFEINENLKLRNIIGYNRIEALNAGEFDGTHFPSDDNGTDGRGGVLKQFSEELQLQGETASGKLSYVTGLYYSDEEDDVRSTSVLFDLRPAAPPVVQINNGIISNETMAIYAQGTFDLSNWMDGLGFTIGARYSEEDVEFFRKPDDVYIANPAPPGAVFINPQQDTFEQVSWTVGLQRQVNPDTLVYLVSRKSFRSGGFNYFAPPLEGFGNDGGGEYQEEAANDIEVGVKFAGTIGQTPTRLNVAAYQMKIDDIQRSNYVSIFGALAGITVNVPEATIKGLELDGEVRPTSWLTLGAALNYTDAEFTKNNVSVLGNPTVAFGPYPDAPEFSGSVFVDAKFAATATIDASIRADLYHQTSTFFSSTGNTLNPGTEIPGYSVANLRVGLDFADSGWSVAAYLKNAFDKTYYVGGIGFASLFAVNTVIPGAPRTYMLEARYSF